ncbi:hypothetical protein PAI11_31480 [Patulibacter medicamentivorans]|uniref:Uncharacterized protein n=1 Tax=Patulibacter medicamentivorans TaxID=1097667 RepID=H0E8I7_9ACTN|nr:hypothetical protein PAI11_31480 [Patulibacter medicamentivorans]
MDRALLAFASGPLGQLAGTLLDLSAYAAVGARQRLARAVGRRLGGR